MLGEKQTWKDDLRHPGRNNGADTRCGEETSAGQVALSSSPPYSYAQSTPLPPFGPGPEIK